jgi:hypothetical protein
LKIQRQKKDISLNKKHAHCYSLIYRAKKVLNLSAIDKISVKNDRSEILSKNQLFEHSE